MEYSKLKELANKYIRKAKIFPLSNNSLNIANGLGLKTKNSMECKKDFSNSNTPYPLESANACLALVDGEYVIYYNEEYEYKNFAVAHEIAHFLLHHKSDGVIQHHDANLLAAMIVAPESSIIKNKIKDENALSKRYKIPIEIAKMYWCELAITPKNKYITAVILSSISLLTAICIICCASYYRNSNVIIPADLPTPTALIELDVKQDNPVFVTIYGQKYHKSDCYYIEDKDSLTELTIEQADNLGYEKCKICF